MADYSYSCCGGPPHKQSCKFHHNYAVWKAHQEVLARYRSQGFVSFGNDGLYKCRRGCGTVVWDVDTHIKNVCPSFNPVVG